MINIKYLALSIAAIYMTGCSVINNKSASDDKPVTRVYVDSACPQNSGAESFGAVAAGLFLEPLISAGIKGIGGAIKKAGEDKLTTVRGSRSTHFYSLVLGETAQEETKINLLMGCLTIVHGQLSKSNDPAIKKKVIADFLKRYPDRIEEGNVNNYLSPDDLGGDTQVFSDDIRFFIQYQVALSNDLTAMRLVPVTALFGKRIGKGNKSKTDLVIVSSFQTPSKSGTDGAFAMATSKFSDIQANKHFEDSELEYLATGWMPLPAIPEIVKARVKANAQRRLDLRTFQDTVGSLKTQISEEKKAAKKKELEKLLESALTSIERLKDLIVMDKEIISDTTPITVNVVLTETQKGNEFLVKLGTYLGENSTKIAKPIAEAVDPSKRETAKVATQDKEVTLRIAAIEAAASHEAEEDKTGNDRNESKIRVTKIKASQACRKLRAAGYDDVMCLGY